MAQSYISKATLGRLPLYLNYIKSEDVGETVSSTRIAKGLGLGEVQVRKDLSIVCSDGRPKIGYKTDVLAAAIEEALGVFSPEKVVLVGAGKLGRALLGFGGFKDYGVDIVAGFDSDERLIGTSPDGKPIYPMEKLAEYCRENSVHIGVLTVPESVAQTVCEFMMECGIDAIWNFSPANLKVPEGVLVKRESLAIGLAHLAISSRTELTR